MLLYLNNALGASGELFNGKREDRTTLEVSSTHLVADDTSGSQYLIQTKSGEINNKNPESISLSICWKTDAISSFGRRYTTSASKLQSKKQAHTSPATFGLLVDAGGISCRVYRETILLQGFDGVLPMSGRRLPECIRGSEHTT